MSVSEAESKINELKSDGGDSEEWFNIWESISNQRSQSGT